MKKRTHCDICGANDLEPQYTYQSHGVLGCRQCNTLCRAEVFDAEECARLYSREYFCVLQKDFFFTNIPLRRRAFQRKLDCLAPHRPDRGELLDLGCATGLFLELAQQQGWRVTGVEFSEYAAAVAIDEKQLRVLVGDLLDQHFPDRHFDAVTMWDMIDHSESPSTVIREVRRILRPGGLVAMDTFMEDALLFSLAHAAYRLTGGLIATPSLKAHPIHHSHYFSRTTFRRLLECNGFEILEARGSNLDAATVSLGRVGKWVVALFNRLSSLCGREMEMMLIGRKTGE
ncbi:MAG: class I SAM-dependent methyltransferase [Candidatus Riflebacteria bacterium]|nr:class I SAM-dependent methyltransferase [Candidatus Riflebacteria bacterium]